MKLTLNDEIIRILEEHDFSYSEVNKQGDECYIDLSQYTPAGEDWYVCVLFDGTTKSLIESIEKIVDNFDVDEEVEIFIDNRGKNGIPSSVRTLIEDAEWKLETLQSLADALEDLELDEEDN